MKESFESKLKTGLSIVVLFLLGIACILLSFLTLENTKIEALSKNKRLIKSIIPIAITLIVMIAFVLQTCDKSFVFRLTVVFFCAAIAVCLVAYLLKRFKIEEIIGSTEELRTVIKSYGKYTLPAFIFFQICQVLFLPVPSVVTFGVGVALFGVVKTAIISYFSVLTASIIAFIIGRKLGYKAVSWLVGKKMLEKGLKLIKGKDEIAITLMLVFPFFPDDLLCFVSGLTSMSLRRFALTVAITRFISVVVLSIVLSGYLKVIFINPVFCFGLIFLVIVGIICLYMYKSAKKMKGRPLKVTNGKNYSSHRS